MSAADSLSKYFLDKLGEKFWLATLIPSVMLVIASFIVFDPILNISSSKVVTLDTITDRLFVLGVLVVIPSLAVGFVLYVIQTYVVRLFQGYVFSPFGSRPTRIHVLKANKLLDKIHTLENDIAKLEIRNRKKAGTKNEITNLKKQYYAAAVEYDQNYPPPDDNSILPTLLGNILKASEDYPRTRYGMDAVVWWPRLYNLLPHETKTKIEESVNELHILLNFSALSICFYFLCLIAIFLTGTVLVADGTFSWLQAVELTLRYIGAAMTALFVCGFFYRLSLFSARAFGMQLRGAFDLHRFLLLEQMRVKLPKNSDDEFYLWKNLGELIVLGNLSLDFTSIDYDWQQYGRRRAKSRTKRNLSLQSRTTGNRQP